MDSSVQVSKLTVPDCTREQLAFARPNNRSIQDWLGNLPRANTGEMAKELYFALQELNQTRLPAVKRLSILELFRPHCHYTCQGLRKHFHKKPVILSDREFKIASLVQALLNHLYSGYKLVINQLIQDSKHDRHHQHNLALALHRAINESSRIFLHRYQLYRNALENGWQELHTLYLLAEQHGVDKALIEDKENVNLRTTTLLDSYKRVLLMSLARPNMLRQLELEQLFQMLEQWASYASLAPEAAKDDCAIQFVIDCHCAEEPGHGFDLEASQEDSVIRLLRTDQLISELESGQASANLPEALINHLVSAWGPRTQRAYQRHKSSGEITLTVGLTNAHYFLSGRRGFQKMLLDDIGERLLAQQHSHFEAENNGDLWNHVAGAVSSGNQLTRMTGDMVVYGDQGEDIKTVVYPTLQAQLVDFSSGGDCARIKGEVPALLQAGELIGLRVQPDAPWVLAIIRWIRSEGKSSVIFGIKLLSPNAQPSAISILHKKRGDSDLLRCFYLPAQPETGTPARLITPKVPFQPGSKVRFFDGTRFIQSLLTERIASTGCISEFLFSPIGQPPAAAPEKPKQHDSEHQPQDDFETLWPDL